MNILVFDTETTGLMPGNICQLSYLMRTSRGISGKNFYFAVDYIEPAAQRVHGLSVEKLRELSGGHGFRDSVSEILKDFAAADRVISHNFDFDQRFMSAELRRLDRDFNCSCGFCTMKFFTPICKLKGRKTGYKYPRLEEVIRFMGIDSAEILQTTREAFGSADTDFHDARFDVAGTFLCYERAIERGHIREQEDGR